MLELKIIILLIVLIRQIYYQDMGKKISQRDSHKSNPLSNINQNQLKYSQNKLVWKNSAQVGKQNNQARVKNNDKNMNKIEKLSIESIKPNLMFRKRQWTQKQDQLLLNAIEKYGPHKWGYIAQFIPGRIGKQCRQRWHNHLNPNINKDQWSQQEQLILFLLYTLHGGKWALMTKVLTERTDNSIKNHWNSIMQKKISTLQSKLFNLVRQKIIKFNSDELSQSFLQHNSSLIQNQSTQNQILIFSQKYPQLIDQIIAKLSIQQEQNSKDSLLHSQIAQFKKGFKQINLQKQQSLPSTSEQLQFKQKGFSFVVKNQSKTDNQLSFQSLLKGYDLPFLIKNISSVSGQPEMNQQTQKYQNTGLFESNMKMQKNLSFVDKQKICSSPKIKAEYSKLFSQDSDNNELGLLDYPQMIKRKSSKNYILTSPAAFLQRKSSQVQ